MSVEIGGYEGCVLAGLPYGGAPGANRANPDFASPEVRDDLAPGMGVFYEVRALAAFPHALHPFRQPRIDFLVLVLGDVDRGFDEVGDDVEPRPIYLQHLGRGVAALMLCVARGLNALGNEFRR